MLPILQHRSDIIDSVRNNQVTIVVGETGSGKTTEIPKYLYEAGFGAKGMIGITEPRRIAATSVASFVAQNLNVAVGKTVAYKIRFNDETDSSTVVKFMTDGILLREFHDDPLLSKYSVIMVDEAHERSANIDFLLGLLKQALAKRPDLRLIIASATINAGKFSDYFGGAPVLTISGRLHPVEIVWQEGGHWSAIENVVPTIEKILNSSREGDVLVFLSGIDDINAVEERMGYLRGSHNMVVLPVHGGLPPEEQSKVFRSYPQQRKVILATNIAETSITIDGVVYVVDTGLVKQTNFIPSIGIQTLDECEHSQAGCNQRAGRAGRTRPGVCYRLYSQENYRMRPEFTEPEIKRMSLAGVVLAMEALEISDIKNFDFIDPPDAHAFQEAYSTLEVLGAIVADKPGLTAIGKEMAALPLEPRVSRMVVEAKRHGCVENVVTVAAFMSVGRSVFARPKGKEWEADAQHRPFKQPTSDMLTVLRVWKEFEVSGFDKDWCFKHFLVHKTLQEVRTVRTQLLQQLSRLGVKTLRSTDDNVVLRSVAAGLAHNVLRHVSRHSYEGVEGHMTNVFIHPGSSLFGAGLTPWVVSAEIVETSKRFARMCSVVHVEWLPEIAPTHFWYGQRVLKSYSPRDNEAVAATPIMYKNKYGMVSTVGEVIARVSMEEAWHIHQRSIEWAQETGLVLLTIDIVRDRFSLTEAIGRTPDGEVYRVSSVFHELQRDERYFCEVKHDMLVRGYAYPRLRMFDVLQPSQNGEMSGSAKSLARIAAQAPEGSLGSILAQALLKREGGR